MSRPPPRRKDTTSFFSQIPAVPLISAAPPLFSVRIFSLLSAILHLGNIRYKKKTYRDDSIDICNPEVLPIVSELLEVSALFKVVLFFLHKEEVKTKSGMLEMRNMF